MKKKEQIMKELDIRYPIWVYSPKGWLDPSLAVKCSNLGGVGLIDAEGYSLDELRDIVARLKTEIKGENWGVRISSKEQLKVLEEFSVIPIVIVGFDPDHEELNLLRTIARLIVAEVLYTSEAHHKSRWADFFFVKGSEAGGLIGEKPSFIQLQEFFETGYPFIIQGGFGVYNIAPAFIAGAIGVVLEGQTYLLPECPLPDEIKQYLSSLAENDSYILGEPFRYKYRLAGKLANKEILKLKKEERERLLNLDEKEFLDVLRAIGKDKSFFRESNIKHAFLPLDQGLFFAKYIKDKFQTLKNYFEGLSTLIKEQIQASYDHWPFSENSEFAQSLRVKFPIVQGPMANVSDKVDFAKEVVKGGAFPIFALGGLTKEETEQLFSEIKHSYPSSEPYGCGIIGLEAVKERREEHLKLINQYQPDVVLIAAGTVDLAVRVKNMGFKTFLHTPALSMFQDAIKKGLDYLILEGGECGGHIGTLSSLFLWESILEFIDAKRTLFEGKRVHVLFAGGIGDGLATAMVASMLGKHLDVISPGIQSGTAYLFTDEIVATGALSVVYQEVLLNAKATRVIGTTVNTRARAVPTQFVSRTLKKELERIVQNIPISERKKLYEKDNLGALRIATKAEIWNPNHIPGSKETTQFLPIEESKQRELGCFMAGELICRKKNIYRIEELHYSLISEGKRILGKQRAYATSIFKEITVEAREHRDDISHKIAIVGIGCVFPDAFNVEEYWNNIITKKYSIIEVPKDRWDPELYYDPDPRAPDKTYSKIGAFIRGFKFDSIRYRIPPAIAKHIDDVQKWAIEAAKQALEDANIPTDGKKRLSVAVIVGNSLGGEIQRETNKRINIIEVAARIKSSDYFRNLPASEQKGLLQELEKLKEEYPTITEDTMPGELSNVIAGRIANIFNLSGQSMSTDAACASSLAAIDTAIKGLINHDFDVVLAGGADRSMDPATYIKFAKIGALSGKASRPFDADADGFVMGEGAGFVVLKRLEDAIKDGDKIYAVITGFGASSDGKGKGITAPNPLGQSEAIYRALEKANLTPDDVDYIEAHATSTRVGDAAELNVLYEIFKDRKRKEKIGISSVKSQIGHLKSAAGIASLIKATLALYHKILPPSVNVSKLNPRIDWDKAPYYVITEPQKWEKSNVLLRRAGVSAFGFGGTNYHIILEEFEPEYHMELLKAAKTAPTTEKPVIISYMPSSEELTSQASQSKPAMEGLAFLFTGQGSQYLGMLKELNNEPVVAKTLDEAEKICLEFGGFSIKEIIFGSEKLTEYENNERLKQTQYTQPALFVTEMALYRYFKEKGLLPAAVAGHSLGEYAALVSAGVLSFEDGLKAVITRGKAMANASASSKGAMAAVFAPIEEIEKTLSKIRSGYIIVANYNSLSQTVISGEEQAIDEAIKLFTEQGRKAIKLRVSTAFHSKIVENAEKELSELLFKLKFNRPQIPVYSNVSGEKYPADPEKIRELLIQQITSPVQWVKIINNMYKDGSRIFVEIGPKKALYSFVKDILKDKDNYEAYYSLLPGQERKTIEDLLSRITSHLPSSPSIPTLASQPQEVFSSTAWAVLEEDKEIKDLTKNPTFKDYLKENLPLIKAMLTEGFRIFERKYRKALDVSKKVEKLHLNLSNIGITGVGIGIPGKNNEVFSDENIEKILHGHVCIDKIDDETKQKMVEKNIVKLVKRPDGSATFEYIDDVSKVIQLAAQLGSFNPEKDYGISSKLLKALDTSFQLAIAAGLEALRDAGIPLVKSNILTSTGKVLEGEWVLHPSLQEETGIVFASAFPGYESLVDEIEKHFVSIFADKSRKQIDQVILKLLEKIDNEEIKNELGQWYFSHREELLGKENEPHKFSREFLFKILSMGHSQFAQFIKAKGPNTAVNAACASTTQAIGIAEDWIRTGRCKRVIVIAGENAAGEKLLPWIGSGFLAAGGATTKSKLEEAVLPFGKGRNGLIVGSVAAGLVLESEEAYKERGVKPIVDLLGTYFANSAYHGSRLDVNHISQELDKFISYIEEKTGIKREEIALEGMFVSHETYTPARGGSSEAEIRALERTFGPYAKKMVIINTKGYTGHPMGAGIEECIAIKSMEKGIIPPIPNLDKLDPSFEGFNFSRGMRSRKKYALRLAAGFGSQLAFVLFRLNSYQNRFLEPQYQKWLQKIGGRKEDLFIEGRVLKIKETKEADKKGITEKAMTKTISPSSSDIVQEQIIAIISEKTGYEREILDPQMDLEADLGIDTVKQVEIMGVIKERFNLPEGEDAALANYRTIADISKYIAERAGSIASKGTPSKSTYVAEQSLPVEKANTIQDQIIEIISEKTGYERDVLDPQMDLEADLGIDTVKQVEIMGVIKERFNLPEGEDAALANYRTIADISKYIAEQTYGSVSKAEKLPTTPSISTKNIESIQDQIIEIISEKTGYEREVLDPQMDLEADLGIDTVKQVEIMGVIKERFDLPEGEDAALANYRTIADISQYIANMTTITTQPSDVSAGTIDEDEIRKQVLEVICAITGYEVEQLKEDMDLEAELGIDSVKQTEIISTLASKFNIETSVVDVDVASFLTIKDIIDLVKKLVSKRAPEIEAKVRKEEREIKAYIVEPTVYPLDKDKADFINIKDYEMILVDFGSPMLPKIEAKLSQLASKVRVVNGKKVEEINALSLEGNTYLLLLLPKGNSIDALEIFEKLFLLFRSLELTKLQYVVAVSPEELFGIDNKAHPISGGVIAFLRSLSYEFPLNVKQVFTTQWVRLIDELQYWDGTVEIGYKDGVRYVLELSEVNPAVLRDEKITFEDNDVLLATGGARGITFECVKKIVEEGKIKNVALLGRTKIDDVDESLLTLSAEELKEKKKQFIEELVKTQGKLPPVKQEREWEKYLNKIITARNIEELKKLGANVIYYSADITDKKQVSKAVKKIKKDFNSSVSVIIHGAGIEESKSFLKKQLDYSKLIVSIKVEGLNNLLGSLPSSKLKRLILFSSIAGRFGNRGQVDYAFANGYLSRISWSLNKKGINTTAIDWSAWKETGMATKGGILKILEQVGITPIPTNIGTKYFSDIITNTAYHEILVAGKLGTFYKGLGTAEVKLNSENFRMLDYVKIERNSVKAEKTLRLSHDLYLKDHRIQNIPILPGVMGLEAFAELFTYVTGVKASGFRNVEFKQAVKVLNKEKKLAIIFDKDNREFILKSEKGQSKADQEHFKAKIDETLAVSPTTNIPSVNKIVPFMNKRDIYKIFFHGPSFAVLEQLVTLNETEIVCTSSLPKEPVFSEKYSLHFNPLAVEAALQAAGLLALIKYNLLALPSKIKRVAVLNNKRPHLVYAKFVKRDEAHSYYNVTVVDNKNKVIVEMEELGLIHTRMPLQLPAEAKEKLQALRDYIQLERDINEVKANFVSVDTVNQLFTEKPKYVLAFLTETERKALEKISNNKRKVEYLAGLLAIKELLSYGELKDSYKNCEIRKEKNGRPYLYDLKSNDRIPYEISITHSGHFAVAVIDQQKVGVDLERIEEREESFYKTAFTYNEQEKIALDTKKGTVYWTIKESVLKALGEGLHLPLSSIEISEEEGQFKIKLSEKAQKKIAKNADFNIKSYSAEKYVLSICKIMEKQEE